MTVNDRYQYRRPAPALEVEGKIGIFTKVEKRPAGLVVPTRHTPPATLAHICWGVNALAPPPSLPGG